jgi:hypothetical protein
LVNTWDANADEACSFAWMQLLRRQPMRETVLSWLTTVAIREPCGSIGEIAVMNGCPRTTGFLAVPSR